MSFIKVCISLFFSLAISTIQAELLIIKKAKDKDGQELFAPLDLEDKADNAAAPIISQIILKYEWPMCIASDLTEAEKNELLRPGKSYAEEKFIQKKIDEAFKPGMYYVVFIPTTLYELFCIKFYVELRAGVFKNTKNIYLQASSKVLEFDIDKKLVPILNEKNDQGSFFKFSSEIRKQVFGVYQEINTIFFNKDDYKKDVFFYINNEIDKELFTHIVNLANSKNVEELSGLIASKAIFLLKDTFDKIVETTSSYKYILDGMRNVVIQSMNLDYEARILNKALIFRGTFFVEGQIDVSTKKGKLVGTTIVPHHEVGDPIVLYGAKKVQPFSISFGNSLFAGIVNHGSSNPLVFLKNHTLGYALFIDKKSYIDNQNNNLFFIPPLSVLAALFAWGELFHARAKAAVDLKTKITPSIRGLAHNIDDPTGILLITRDPLKHADFFSRFLAKNARIIQTGKTDDLTQEEKKTAEDILKNQAQAAMFYKDVYVVAPTIRKATAKRKEKLDQKKQKKDE